MDSSLMQETPWRLLKYATSVCKPLLWLRDTDSSFPLATKLVPTLQDALHTIADLPNAIPALCDKMISTYQRALNEPWVGIGAQERSSRLGKRTAELGLMRALEYARTKQPKFEEHANSIKRLSSSAKTVDWKELFSLVEEFIDYLDWGEFVIENARGQASNLVLETIELLEAIYSGNNDKIMAETGDVFYNLMACCLSLRIGSQDIVHRQPSSNNSLQPTAKGGG